MIGRKWFKQVWVRCAVGIIVLQLAFPSALLAQVSLNLPLPGAMLPLSSAYNPVMLNGLTLNTDNPLAFDFIVNSGDTGLVGEELRAESDKLVKYFLTALTVPDEELWVNLSPYEKDRVIPDAFGVTAMGRDLLAQDYLLKQITSSLMNPAEPTGQDYWGAMRQRMRAMFGDQNQASNSMHKIWIVPEKAVVYEHGNTAYVMESHLKVMLEEDYFAYKAARTGGSDSVGGANAEVATVAMREVLLPEIEREVNSGEHFAPLRQIYNAVILASWFKDNLRESLLGQVYVDQHKTRGIESGEPEAVDAIYQRYLDAISAGLVDVIAEEYDPVAQDVVARKYFTGGAHLATEVEAVGYASRAMLAGLPEVGNASVNIVLGNGRSDASPAMTSVADREQLASIDIDSFPQSLQPTLVAIQRADGRFSGSVELGRLAAGGQVLEKQNIVSRGGRVRGSKAEEGVLLPGSIVSFVPLSEREIDLKLWQPFEVDGSVLEFPVEFNDGKEQAMARVYWNVNEGVLNLGISVPHIGTDLEFRESDINFRSLQNTLTAMDNQSKGVRTIDGFLREQLKSNFEEMRSFQQEMLRRLKSSIGEKLESRDLYRQVPGLFAPSDLSSEMQQLLGRIQSNPNDVQDGEIKRLNAVLLNLFYEGTFGIDASSNVTMSPSQMEGFISLISTRNKDVDYRLFGEEIADYFQSEREIEGRFREGSLRVLNSILNSTETVADFLNRFFDSFDVQRILGGAGFSAEIKSLLTRAQQGYSSFTRGEVVQLKRALLGAKYPIEIRDSDLFKASYSIDRYDIFRVRQLALWSRVVVEGVKVLAEGLGIKPSVMALASPELSFTAKAMDDDKRFFGFKRENESDFQERSVFEGVPTIMSRIRDPFEFHGNESINAYEAVAGKFFIVKTTAHDDVVADLREAAMRLDGVSGINSVPFSQDQELRTSTLGAYASQIGTFDQVWESLMRRVDANKNIVKQVVSRMVKQSLIEDESRDFSVDQLLKMMLSQNLLPEDVGLPTEGEVEGILSEIGMEQNVEGRWVPSKEFLDSLAGSPVDRAILAKKVGGVDLSRSVLDLDVRGDNAQMAVPTFEALPELMNNDGFTPVIIQIQPIVNLPLLLGLADEPANDHRYSASEDDSPISLPRRSRLDADRG